MELVMVFNPVEFLLITSFSTSYDGSIFNPLWCVFSLFCSDRSIALYDLRMSSPARKIIMRVWLWQWVKRVPYLKCFILFHVFLWVSFLWQTKTNSICWNPREPMNFTAVSTRMELSDFIFLDVVLSFLAYIAFIIMQSTW